MDVLRRLLLPSKSAESRRDRSKSVERPGDSRKLVKGVEIVADVFRKAADKVGKVGEREWRQVFEQQRYVLDELLTAQTTKDAKPFDEALSDFNFLL